MMSTEDRAIGSLIGLAVGDAVGTTLEFMSRGSFEPITDMIGGGPFSLSPGQWTDDTSMALCLANSLIFKQGFDPIDQMNRYCNWYQYGYMSSTGDCFDIGATVSGALNQYLKTGNPFSGSSDSASSGNGSLMRLAPISIFYRQDEEELIHFAGESSRTTHASAECIDACRYFSSLIGLALAGCGKSDLVRTAYRPYTEGVGQLADGKYLDIDYEALTGSGYVIESLKAALWCFHHASSFREAILLSANIGNDADTTAAICGQLAGAFYGVSAIPTDWVNKLFAKDYISCVAMDLYQHSNASHSLEFI